jgi:hypothetical protein
MATKRITKNTMTRVIPMLRGSGAAAALTPATGPEQPVPIFPYWNTSDKILPDPLNGCTSLLMLKLAKQPSNTETYRWILVLTVHSIISFYVFNKVKTVSNKSKYISDKLMLN